MKKLSVFLIIALFAMFFVSCSNDDKGDKPVPKGSTCWEGEAGQLYAGDDPYTGNGKVYMGDERDNFGKVILTPEKILEVGTVNSGKITFNFPQNVDTSYLRRLYSKPPEKNIEPNGIQMWTYTDPLRLISNSGEYIGDISYNVRTEDTYNGIYCWYFSEETTMSGYEGGEVEGEPRTEFTINAKNGWNKIYRFYSRNSSWLTTDLSNVPEELMWRLREE